jgi:diguanylate cyclase (GGDEF)-like protein/PAS domain S-box-containing protein
MLLDGSQSRHDSDLLRRIAGTVSIMLYEMECHADGSFECTEFVGLESLIGRVPDGISPEDAYDAAVHPDDREAYELATVKVAGGEPADVEYRLVSLDGTTRWVLDRMRPESSHAGRSLVSGVVADITARKLAERDLLEAQQQEAERLEHAGLHDPLTGLPNRIAFQRYLDEALARSGRTGAALGVLFIDLDNFKLINDSFGHAAGDGLLMAVATRLRSTIRKADIVCRQGGDEFLILLADLDVGVASAAPDSAGLVAAEDVGRKLGRILQAPFSVEGIEVFITASVGISLFPRDAADAETLLKHADVAMYTVKQAGRDGHSLYELGNDTALKQISAATRLRKTIDRGQGLVLHYQPLVNIETGELVGCEALIRWQDGERGLVPPDEFIPLAERVGLIGPITDWVIGEACRQATAWRDRGLDLYVSINVPPSYCQPTGMNHLLTTARDAGIGLDRLVIEVTESALSPDSRQPIEPTLAEMRRCGLQLAIDDFGTGYSSLGRLNQSWVSMLKIDRSFVSALPGDEHAAAIVRSVVELADRLGLEPIAEGIETEEQRRFLVECGCRFGQGFLFSRAVPSDEMHAFALEPREL